MLCRKSSNVWSGFAALGEVEVILKGWKQTEGAVHLVTPPGGPRPARVEVLADFLMKQFAKGKRK